MGVPVRDRTHWVAGYGLTRASLKLLARRGDPMAQLLRIDTDPVNNIYPLIEQIRERGRMSPVRGAASDAKRSPIPRFDGPEPGVTQQCTPAWERRWRAWNSISACSRCSSASPS
jgi:hypothetical protein